MRVLITGAAGFIGSSLCDHLLRAGKDVIGVDCLTQYYDPEIKRQNLKVALDYQNFEFHSGDLASVELSPLLEGVGAIFHQAGQPGVRASWGSEFEAYARNNILVTQRLLEAARTNADVTAFVAASSSSVYGVAERYPTTELDLPQPISPYGVTKLAAEHLCTLYGTQFGLPTASLRYFTVYGPRQRPDMAIHRLINAAVRNSSFTLYGDGEQRRDFTFVDDIVRANLQTSLWLQNGGTAGEVFNVGSRSPIRVRDVISAIESIVGNSIEIRHEPRQDGDPKETGADCRRIEHIVGWRPSANIHDGLIAQVESITTSLQ